MIMLIEHLIDPRKVKSENLIQDRWSQIFKIKLLVVGLNLVSDTG